MPHDRKTSQRLQDILDSIERIRISTAGLDYEQFITDYEKTDSVLYRLTIIGEVVVHLPDEMKLTCKQVPWREITATRNVIIHGYFQVDLTTLWQTIQDDLPALEVAVRGLLHDQQH